MRRASHLRGRAAGGAAPGDGGRPGRARPRVRGDRAAVHEPGRRRQRADPAATHRLLQRRLDVARRPRARRRTGPGRQHVRGDRDDRGPLRPRVAQRPGRGRTGVSRSAARRSARPVRCACRVSSGSTSVHFDEVIELDAGGPLTKQALREPRGRRRAAVQHRSRPRRRSVRRARRRPGPATGGERHARSSAARCSTGSGPGVADPVNEVSARLTTDALRELNAEVQSGILRCGRSSGAGSMPRGSDDDRRATGRRAGLPPAHAAAADARPACRAAAPAEDRRDRDGVAGRRRRWSSRGPASR